MRATPPPSRPGSDPGEQLRTVPNIRCPYLEQILKDRAGPFRLLTRFRADCHVDHRSHTWTGRHPTPPCITQPTTCALYQRARRDEDRLIARYTD